MKENLCCGIVGMGFAGIKHVEAMRRVPGVQVVAACGGSLDRTRQKALRFGIPKVYSDFRELVADPAVDVVDIVTPTHLHHPIALAAIESGKHVIVDKPLALNSAQSAELLEAAEAKGVFHAVTYNYRSFPMVQRARVMLRRGDVGEIHFLHGHYLQEWLLHDTDFSWRLDATQSGPSGMIGDAGTHWFDLIEYLTGLRIVSVLADLKTVIKSRALPSGDAETFSSLLPSGRARFSVTVPDLGTALLRFHNGANGTFSSSSLCAGHKNDLRFELHGSTGSLAWRQELPEAIWMGRRGGPDQLFRRETSASGTQGYPALPAGHCEGWTDAFRDTMQAIFSSISVGVGQDSPVATFSDGLRSSRIIDALLTSSASGGRWTPVEEA